MKEEDLRYKSVFDFTQDKEIISRVLSIPVGVDYDEYIEYYLESCNPVNYAVAISEFAKITGNTELGQVARNLHTQLIEEFVNSAHEIHTTTGMLVD